MDVVYERCAGLDVHKKTVVACVALLEPLSDQTQSIQKVKPGNRSVATRYETRTFETMTDDLLQMSEWLAEMGVTHIAMESTGEYWKPIYNILEAHVRQEELGDNGGSEAPFQEEQPLFQLMLVNAHHIKMVPGRKTDVKDAQWIAQLLQHGLLHASFVPPASQRILRDLTRHRTTFVRSRATLSNRIQKLLEGANIKLASVATNVLGVSGRDILKALAEGESDATTLAKMAVGKLQKKDAALCRALNGQMKPHQRLLLREMLVNLESLDASIANLTAAIQAASKDNLPPGQSGPIGSPGPSASSEPQDSNLNALSFQDAVTLIAMIPGVGVASAEMMVGEFGTDMSRFPTAKHLCSWAGVAPGNKESAGKQLSGRTRSGNTFLKSGLVQCAHAAARTRATYLSAQYKRLAPRRGAKRAALAVAHSILTSIYHMLKNHQQYRELGPDYFNSLNPEAILKRLTKKLNGMGYQVSVTPMTPNSCTAT